MKTFVAILAFLGAVLLFLHHVQSSSADVLTRRGHEAYRTGDYGLAIHFYSKVIAEGTRADHLVAVDEAYAGRGRAYLKAEDFRAAQADLSAAIERKPTAALYIERSVARQGLGDAVGAVNDLRSATKLDGRNAEAHRKLCPLLVQHEGNEAALPTCLQMAKLGQPISETVKPELEATLCRLAEAAYSREDHEGFLSRYQDFRALSPNAAADTFAKSRLAHSHYQLGEGFLRGGDRDAAVEHYEVAIGLDPKDLYRRRAVTTLFTAGESSEAEGQYGQAVTYYERALELAGSTRSEVEARLADARRMERCHSLKNSGDSALRRIDWTLVERANEILGPVNRGSTPTTEEALFLYNNAEELADSVGALMAANKAYRDLMNTDCPSQITNDAFHSNLDLIISWTVKANAFTEYLVNRLEK